VADLVAKGLYTNIQYIRWDSSDQQDLVPTTNLLLMCHINFISDHSTHSYHNVKINEIPLLGNIIIYYIITFLHIDDTFIFFYFLLTRNNTDFEIFAPFFALMCKFLSLNVHIISTKSRMWKKSVLLADEIQLPYTFKVCQIKRIKTKTNI